MHTQCVHTCICKGVMLGALVLCVCAVNVGRNETRFTDCESKSWQSQVERSLHQTKHSLQANLRITWSSHQWWVAAFILVTQYYVWLVSLCVCCLFTATNSEIFCRALDGISNITLALSNHFVCFISHHLPLLQNFWHKCIHVQF